jgi:hypothetical protein
MQWLLINNGSASKHVSMTAISLQQRNAFYAVLAEQDKSVSR